MAKINYGFEKRQRELAKQKKQEAKDARKREARAAKSPGSDDAPVDQSGGDESAAVTSSEPAAPAEGAPRVHRRATGTTEGAG